MDKRRHLIHLRLSSTLPSAHKLDKLPYCWPVVRLLIMMPSRSTPFRHNDELYGADHRKDPPLMITVPTKSVNKSQHRSYGSRSTKRCKEDNTLEPPSIAMSSSSSSLSSESTISVTMNKKRGYSKLPSYYHGPPPLMASKHCLHPGNSKRTYRNSGPSSLPPPEPRRGMVLASTDVIPNTPPPMQPARSENRSPQILSPPRPLRLTAHPPHGLPEWVPLHAEHRERQYGKRHPSQCLQHRNITNMSYRAQSFSSEGGCDPDTGHFCYPHHPFARIPLQPFILYNYECAPEVIGHPSLRTFQLQLPPKYLYLLDYIVAGCEKFAKSHKNGWRTNLYSLTKQDLALADIPGMLECSKPITEHISRCICELYHAESLRVDHNQPHVLKYSKEHTGVELHHDRCDVTANLMLSRSHTYVGGG